MNYFVTGATGFIGRFVVERLLKRSDAKVYVLIRESSKKKFTALKHQLKANEKALVPVWGDITQVGLTDVASAKKLKGKIDHVFHLAAVYDMNMDDETGDRINNEGTRNVVNFVNGLGGAVRLQHVSSVAVAGGKWVGNFTEDMFDEGQDTSHPYFRTKFQSELIVRQECRVPWQVYRPGAVVGSSETGEMDKIDGPYYLFPIIKQIRNKVPKWLPLLGVEGGKFPLAPVDYVADAMIALAHKEGLEGQAFHLLQKPQDSIGRVLEVMFDAAHGPGFAKKYALPELPSIVPGALRETAKILPLDAAARQMSKAVGIPVSALGYVTNRAVFDDRLTREALADTDIRCPLLKDYAEKLWLYWETHMDYPRANRRAVARLGGKVVLVTGASSGIGLETAKRFAANGATVVMVARSLDKLAEVAQTIRRKGGDARYYTCDLNNLEAIDEMSAQVLKDLGRVDILINNAGRSIRRAVLESLDRFHDFERTMQLNYFGCIRLIMNVLPTMVENREGHVINISSIGCLANATRFAAYVSSKSALDAFSRCLSAEVKADNVYVSTIYMPLVRTPMIAPTKLYDYAPAWSVDEASELILNAALNRDKRVKTVLGQMAELSYALWPKLNDSMMSRVFQLFPSSVAAKGGKVDEKLTREGMALAYMLRGSHL
jgi:NAD(P)-dependent dehydrogenase (short-subunit alcohol dehydrogenase family)